MAMRQPGSAVRRHAITIHHSAPSAYHRSRHTYHFLNSNDDESVPATLLNRRRRQSISCLLKTHNQ
eukprot:scaffold18633_cov75-Skeletonema_dohrnii-CCMP3373.AAC.1